MNKKTAAQAIAEDLWPNYPDAMVNIGQHIPDVVTIRIMATNHAGLRVSVIRHVRPFIGNYQGELTPLDVGMQDAIEQLGRVQGAPHTQGKP